MKKIIFSIFSFLFLFSIAIPTLAVQGTPSAVLKRETVRNEATQGAGIGERQTLREEVRESLQEKMATVQAQLTERKREIVRNYFNRMVRRLEAAINRLNILISRIESRTAKIQQQDENISLTTVADEVNSAKEKLNQVSIQLETVKTEINQAIESETPKESFAKIKESISEIKGIIIEVHQTLVKVIGDIKGLRVGNTSTPSATTTD